MKLTEILQAPYYNIKLTFEVYGGESEVIHLKFSTKAPFEAISKNLNDLLESSCKEYQSRAASFLFIPVIGGERLPLLEFYATYHEDCKTYLIDHGRSATATMQGLADQLADQDGKIKVLQGVVELKTQQMASLEKTNKELREGHNSTSYMRVTNLERCNDNQQKIIKDLAEREQQQLAKIGELEKTVDGLHAAISNAALVHSQSGKVAELNYQALQSRLNDEITKNKKATETVDQLSNTIGGQNMTIHNLRAQVSDLTVEKKALEQGVSKLREQNNNQCKQIQDLHTKADGLAWAVRNDSNMLSDRNAEVYTLNGRVQDLEAVVRNYTATIAEHKSVSDLDFKRIGDLQKKVDELVGERDKLKAETADNGQRHAEAVGRLMRTNSDLGVEVCKHRDLSNMNKLTINDLHKQIVELRNQIAALEGVVRNDSVIIKNKTKEYEELHRQYKVYAEEAASHRRQVEGLLVRAIDQARRNVVHDDRCIVEVLLRDYAEYVQCRK